MKPEIDRAVFDKAKAAYLGLSIGDAMGATVEFMTPNEIKEKYDVHRSIVGGGWLNLKPGAVTDDTQMSLALGEAILLKNEVNARDIAESFSKWMKSKPVDIGSTVRRGINYYRKHGKTSVPKDEYNAGNGACMRTLPIALASFGYDRNTVVRASRIQSHITHHSDVSDSGTEHIIGLIQMALEGCSKQSLEKYSRDFTDRNPVYSFNKSQVQNPSGYIVETLQAVLQAFYLTDDFEVCLINVVNRGGDADTTGAIAGMLAGSFYGTGSIPERWLTDLDEAIKRQCISQAEKLISISSLDIVIGDTTPPSTSQLTQI